MSAPILGEERLKELLNAQARTFSLTLRLLPRVLRVPLSLGYLLARASDTIADTTGISREQRLELLKKLDASFGGDDPAEWCPAIGVVAGAVITPSERELLASIPSILSVLDDLPERNIILFLWQTILKGQLFDLQRFTPGASPLTREELEEYCYLVAGSVGETWTRLIVIHSQETFLRPVEEMAKLGIAYGKGLQLLNILRDRAEDRELGRIYILEEGVPELMEQASKWLDQGEAYCACLRSGRIRYASEIPLRLARKTLARLRQSPKGVRVKMPRWEVYGVLLKTLPALWAIPGFPRASNPAS